MGSVQLQPTASLASPPNASNHCRRKLSLEASADSPFDLETIRRMKVKTSITLSEDLLSLVDKRARRLKKNRSEFIEAADVLAYALTIFPSASPSR